MGSNHSNKNTGKKDIAINIPKSETNTKIQYIDSPCTETKYDITKMNLIHESKYITKENNGKKLVFLTENECHVITGDKKIIGNFISYDVNDTLLILGTSNNMINIYDINTLDLLETLGHQSVNPYVAYVFFFDKYIVTMSYDSVLIIWENYTVLKRMEYTEKIFIIDIWDNNLVLVSHDGCIRFIDKNLKTNEQKFSESYIIPTYTKTDDRFFVGDFENVYVWNGSRKLQTINTSGYSKIVRFGQKVYTIQCNEYINQIINFPDNAYLIYVAFNDNIQKFNIETGTLKMISTIKQKSPVYLWKKKLIFQKVDNTVNLYNVDIPVSSSINTIFSIK